MRLFGVTSPEDIGIDNDFVFKVTWERVEKMVELDITLSWPNFVKIQKQTLLRNTLQTILLREKLLNLQQKQ